MTAPTASGSPPPDRDTRDETYRDREWLTNRYHETESPRAIAEELGVGTDTIYRWLRKFEIGDHQNSDEDADLKREWRYEDEAFIKPLRGAETGQPTRVVAEAVGCVPETAYKRLRRLREAGDRGVTSQEVGGSLLWHYDPDEDDAA